MYNYGKALKFQRESHDLTQTELAKLTKIKQQNISRWEKEEVLPNIDFCVILADFYGISLDELIGRDEKTGTPYFDQRYNQGTINNTIK